MYYLKYRQRNMVTIPVGVSSNTLLHDSLSNGSRVIGWKVLQVEIVWSGLDVMCSQVWFSDIVFQNF